MTMIIQKFNPPLLICKNAGSDFCSIEERKWCDELTPSSVTSEVAGDVRYIGSMQVNEVWKHYYKEYYVSNYGYVVKIRDEDKAKAERLIPEELKNADEKSLGVQWVDFSNELRDLFRENAFIPLNRHNSGCQVCLNITGKTAEYDIHRIIARFFLEKPEDYNEKSYVVHHIDNNSYNNHVTNLIYLLADTHRGKQHRIYHPMSHK